MLLLSHKTKTPEEAIAAGANPDFITPSGLRRTHLVEVQPTGPASGEIVWEWDAWDHLVQDFDPSKPNYGAVAEHPELIDLNFLLPELFNWERIPAPEDWMHTNALDYNPELDQIMLSPRTFSEVWIIDHSTTTEEAVGHTGGNSGRGGDLLYRWGNPQAFRAGTAADQQLFGQHTPHWIAPGLPGAGNILIFNNGFHFRFNRSHSSIDEIVPPVDGYGYRLNPGSAYAPAEPAWTYVAETPEDFLSPFISGAQRLPNGNTLICYGAHGTLFEVTPEGKTVWKYVSPVIRTGPMRQGSPMPVQHTLSGPGGNPVQVGEIFSGVNVWDNLVFRTHRYAPDYPGMQGMDLTPGAPIELYRSP